MSEEAQFQRASGWCPVGADELVEVRYRNDSTETGKAGNFRWLLQSHPSDIVAWRRAAEPQKTAPEKAWRKVEGPGCPVSGAAWVEIRYRDGDTDIGRADRFRWCCKGVPSDIIEYRFVDADEQIDLSWIPRSPHEAPPAGGILSLYNRAYNQVDGYERLAGVLDRAYNQAAKGKGKERHAGDRPFHEQPMQQISELMGSIDGMVFQAIKKVNEARKLPTAERQVAELLGAINYIAGMVIFIENNAEEPQ